jgi:PEP-CTERM motif
MRKLHLTIGLLSFVAAAPAIAATDPVGDFLPSYSGPQTGEFDVTDFTVLYDPTGQFFRIAGTLNGAIDPETDGYYVIGVDTGAGSIAPFGSIGNPNVTFNQVVIVGGEGEAFVGANDLAFSIGGNMFDVIVPLSLLPTMGADPLDYGFNLWPRTQIDNPADLTAISDFAPDDALLTPTAVPEPATWLSMLLGFSLAGTALRFRRARTAVA